MEVYSKERAWLRKMGTLFWLITMSTRKNTEYRKQATLKIMALVQNHVLGKHVHFSFLSICKQPTWPSVVSSARHQWKGMIKLSESCFSRPICARTKPCPWFSQEQNQYSWSSLFAVSICANSPICYNLFVTPKPVLAEHSQSFMDVCKVGKNLSHTTPSSFNSHHRWPEDCNWRWWGTL